MWWTVFFIYVCFHGSFSEYIYEPDPVERNYTIVGIFSRGSGIQGKVFDECATSAAFGDRRLAAVLVEPNRTDSYSTWRQLCQVCEKNNVQPIAVFGPQDAIADGAVRDQCALAHIPHIQATWQPFDTDLVPYRPAEEEISSTEETNDEEEAGTEDQPKFKNMTVNFYPDSDEISTAFANLLAYYEWDSFAVVYEDEFGLLRIQKILALMTKSSPVVVRKLDPSGDNYRVLKELKSFQQSRYVVDCHSSRIYSFMTIAADLDMLNQYEHYVFTSLDSSMVADEDWMLNVRANITFLSLTKLDELKDPQNSLASRVGKWKGGSPPVHKFPLESLIIDDVTKHLIQAVKKVEIETVGENEDQLMSTTEFICDRDASKVPQWELGIKVQQAILNISSMGITGQIAFDETGKRVNYTLYVIEKRVMDKAELGYAYETIARWDSATQTIIDDRNETEKLGGDIKRYTFKVISRVSKPYFYPKPTCEGEDCPEDDVGYEGFSVDLVDHIIKFLKEEDKTVEYSYRFLENDPNIKYGEYNEKEKKWSGLIGQILDKKADLAVCDLTITEERKAVVDFSTPIMSLGISILYVQDHKVSPETFSFLYPYSLDVWMYIGTAYCVVSIVLYVCARISPADWENPQPCDKDPEELENIWNFKNCAWLTMGSIMTQGCDILPKAFGSRWVCGMWWFFAVIVCQSYIAQLSASMTSALENEPINGAEDLAKQNKIRYGALKGGATYEFFKNSKDKVFKKMYETMEEHPALLVSSNDEGEKRVLTAKGRYAFFMESSSIDYKLKRNCELKKVGDLLDSKDYGIAMPANSPFRKKINNAILKLKEQTILANITDKWWNKMYDAKDCEKERLDEADDVEGDMELENLMGLFLLLIIGLIISVFITAAEFMNEVRNIVVREQVTHKEAFIKELKASLDFSQSQKPVLRNPSRAASLVTSEKLNLPMVSEEDRKERRAAVLENFLDLEKVVQ